MLKYTKINLISFRKHCYSLTFNLTRILNLYTRLKPIPQQQQCLFLNIVLSNVAKPQNDCVYLVKQMYKNLLHSMAIRSHYK